MLAFLLVGWRINPRAQGSIRQPSDWKPAILPLLYKGADKICSEFFPFYYSNSRDLSIQWQSHCFSQPSWKLVQRVGTPFPLFLSLVLHYLTRLSLTEVEMLTQVNLFESAITLQGRGKIVELSQLFRLSLNEAVLCSVFHLGIFSTPILGPN